MLNCAVPPPAAACAAACPCLPCCLSCRRLARTCALLAVDRVVREVAFGAAGAAVEIHLQQQRARRSGGPTTARRRAAGAPGRAHRCAPSGCFTLCQGPSPVCLPAARCCPRRSPLLPSLHSTHQGAHWVLGQLVVVIPVIGLEAGGLEAPVGGSVDDRGLVRGDGCGNDAARHVAHIHL